MVHNGALSYMQRRISRTYELRRRLPEALAGKPAPAHMRQTFSVLINSKTGCFKREPCARYLKPKIVSAGAIVMIRTNCLQFHDTRNMRWSGRLHSPFFARDAAFLRNFFFDLLLN